MKIKVKIGSGFLLLCCFLLQSFQTIAQQKKKYMSSQKSGKYTTAKNDSIRFYNQKIDTLYQELNTTLLSSRQEYTGFVEYIDKHYSKKLDESVMEILKSKMNTIQKVISQLQDSGIVCLQTIKGKKITSSNIPAVESYWSIKNSYDSLVIQKRIFTKRLESVTKFYQDSLDNYSEKLKEENFSTLDSLDELKEKSSKLILDIEYMNFVNYNGRDFGVKQFGIMPQIKYKFHSGIAVYVIGYFWSKAEHPLAKTDLGIEYSRNLTKRWDITVGYARWFFTNGTPSDRKALTNAIEMYTAYDLGEFNIGLFGMYIFGKETFSILAPEINKYIEIRRVFSRKDKIILEPGIRAVFGNNVIYAVNNNNVAAISVMNINTNNTTPFFGILNYEAFLPISYQRNNTTLKLTLNYALPQNAPPLNPTRPYFYFQTNLSYSIPTKKK